jgi:hypothetical protein
MYNVGRKAQHTACEYAKHEYWQYKFPTRWCVVTDKLYYQNVAYKIQILHQEQKMVNVNAITVAQATSCTYM